MSKVPPHDVVQDLIAPCHAHVLRELRPFLLSPRTKPIYNTIKTLLEECEFKSRKYCKNCEGWNEDLQQCDD